ncbi:putative serine/threonine-protein kinase [Zea mays]|uniref:Putative serine/threonine-protein kinase n=1 Tax=Zea mays TaxID=4577 RepID=A0A3L6F3S2_MAIZE|nr:putative serine/threonine-protein kinase [Zea mays]
MQHKHPLVELKQGSLSTMSRETICLPSFQLLKAAGGRANGDGTRKTRTRDRPRAVPAPEANAELQANIDKRRLITHANAKSKSEKFPPPHQDGALGFPLGCSNHMEPSFEPPDPSSFSTVFPYKKSTVPTWSGPLANSTAGNQKRKHKSGRSSKQPATAHARLYTSFHA